MINSLLYILFYHASNLQTIETRSNLFIFSFFVKWTENQVKVELDQQ
jgi:hypothetical protein